MTGYAKAMRVSGRQRGGEVLTLSSYLRDIKQSIPVWCSGCKKWKTIDEPHHDGCHVDRVQALKRYTKAKTRRDNPPSFVVLCLLYGLVLCAAVAGIIVWATWF